MDLLIFDGSNDNDNGGFNSNNLDFCSIKNNDNNNVDNGSEYS